MAWFDKITEKFVQNVANAYIQDVRNEAFALFPKLSVNEKVGKIAVYDKEDWFRIGQVDKYKRTGASESVGDSYTTSSVQYILEEFAFHTLVTEEDRDQYDNPFDPVRDGAKFVINRLMMIVTYNFVSTMLTSGVWGSDYDVGGSSTKWSASGSDPVEDVLARKQAVESLTGFDPNRMAITRDVFNALKTNAAILDRIKYTSADTVTKKVLARLFEVDELIVLRAVYTTAKKGESATSSNTGYMASNRALLVYAPDRPSRKEPSAGYHLFLRSSGQDIKMRRIPRREKNEALQIEGSIQVLPKVIASDLGAYLYNIV